MRAILDTNVLLSGLISPAGIPATLIDAWLDDRFTLISHALQLDELRDVSRRDKIRILIRPSEAGRLINRIAAVAEMPERIPAIQRSPDPRDDFLLGLCEAGKADWLVTGDKADLLDLGRHGVTRIVTASAFALQLQGRR
ncbi:MAG TPA: putative toxin-antitoxin system toxin component, PIN family [Sphingomicrobium sp.]|nr:putative toxin-antitoxin system toxin component, PIN family [Sphingomicrobium sp.]